VFGIIGVISLNHINDRTYYHKQPYDPSAIIDAYYETKDSDVVPNISKIGVVTDHNYQPIITLGGNDYMIQGISPLNCYEAIFGYKLENFPVVALQLGDVMNERAGMLNIINPACYVFGEENNCEPGDQFTVKQIDSARAFINYRPFDFKISLIQQIANIINQIAIVLIIFIFAFCSIRLVNHKAVD